jgi:cytochrome c556
MLGALPGMSMRQLMLLLAGALLGALGAFSAANALHQRNAWPRGVMAVLQHHHGELRRLQRSGSCPASALATHFQRLAQTAADIGPSGASEPPDYHEQARRFVEQATRLASQPPADCQALDAPLRALGEACQGCHRDYR